MTTINIHKDKLLPAAFAYQQRKLKEIGVLQQDMIDEHSSRWFSFKSWTRIAAAKYLSENSIKWRVLEIRAEDVMKEYVKLQTACRVAEDGIVSLDIDVVQRIFGEEQ